MQQNQKQKLVIASCGIYLGANKRRQKGLAPDQRSLARCMAWSSAKAPWLSPSSSLPASGREGVVCQHACVNVQWREVCGAISFVGAMHKKTNSVVNLRDLPDLWVVVRLSFWSSRFPRRCASFCIGEYKISAGAPLGICAMTAIFLFLLCSLLLLLALFLVHPKQKCL